MQEVKLFGFDKNWEHPVAGKAIPILHRLYGDILIRDDLWHFFFEGDHMAIRCTEKSAKHVQQDALDMGFKVEEVPVIDYRENIKTTKKYLDKFLGLFHEFSELALLMEDEDFHLVLERINHCFLNTLSTRKSLTARYEMPGTNLGSGMGWEALAIMHVALGRMFTHGWYHGAWDEQQRGRERERDG